MTVLDASFPLKDLIAAAPCTQEFNALMRHVGIDLSGLYRLRDYGGVRINPSIVMRGLKKHLNTRITIQQVYDAATPQAHRQNLIWLHLFITIPELVDFGLPALGDIHNDYHALHRAVINALKEPS